MDRPKRQPILMAAPVLLVLVVLVPAVLWAQSLPEIARRLRSEREDAPRATRVFTNENIGRVGRDLAAASRTIAPSRTAVAPSVVSETATATSAGPEEETVDEELDEERIGGRTEAQWRRRFADAREEIQRAEDRLTLSRQELQTLDRRLLTESSLYNREAELGPMITGKREEVTAAEARVQEAVDALAALQIELRTAGGPPGWAR